MSQASTVFRYTNVRKRRRREGDGGRGRLELRGMQRDEIQWNDRLTTVEVAEGVTRIEEDAFNNVFPIGDGTAERKYSSIKNVKIAKDVETIGSSAFLWCESLVDVSIADGSRLTTIESSALRKSAVKEMTIPASVQAIASNAFCACEDLSHFAIQGDSENPSALEQIGYGCFFRCIVLKEVYLGHCPLVTTIPPYAFYSCKSLETIVLPPNLETIQRNAFDSCTALASVTFPLTLLEISGGAFGGCAKLETVQFTCLPRRFSASPFVRCPALCHVEFPDVPKAMWAFVLHSLFLVDQGFLGDDSTQAQRSSCVYVFLQARMEELLA